MSEDDHIDIIQRLTRLEAEGLEREKKQDAMAEKLDTLLERFTKYEAKWGGIVMILSALLGLLLAFKDDLKEYFLGR